MPQWEYTKLDLGDVPPKSDDINLLNDAGKEGWELIALTSNNFAYLKRPLPGAAPATKSRGKQAGPKTAS